MAFLGPERALLARRLRQEQLMRERERLLEQHRRIDQAYALVVQRINFLEQEEQQLRRTTEQEQVPTEDHSHAQ